MGDLPNSIREFHATMIQYIEWLPTVAAIGLGSMLLIAFGTLWLRSRR